jgi:hypothetical protein
MIIDVALYAALGYFVCVVLLKLGTWLERFQAMRQRNLYLNRTL